MSYLSLSNIPTSCKSPPCEQSRKEESRVSICRDTIEKTRLIVSRQGQSASKFQHPLQELRRRSLATIPEHDILQHVTIKQDIYATNKYQLAQAIC
ncbi:Uncharacterized protein HZ326_25080 [Fusarium oxysporum f. sp. albedinis]|nr:Uncharacterized protein HZ326_25080 [Fusarium oxysporum f. sp. albedinis]